MEKGSSSSKVVLLIPVLILALAFVAYRYLIVPLQTEKAGLEDTNYELKVRKTELQNLKTHEEEFKTSIEAARIQINEALDVFSGGQSPEKSIVFADTIEKEYGPFFNTLAFGAKELVTQVNIPLIRTAETGEYSVQYADIELNKELLTIGFTCTYGQLKEVAEYIAGYPERMNLKTLTVSYNPTDGNLTGSLGINLYSVVGGEKEYVEPVITDIRLGVENIFTE